VDLELPCQTALKQQLLKILSSFAECVPNTIQEFERGKYQTLVEDFDMDNFGSWGDRQLLDMLGIHEGPQDFATRGARLVIEYQEQHAESWWRSEGLFHQRVVSYAEMNLELAHDGRHIQGCMYQQNGFQGVRHAGNFILATALPFNHNVDRSLCSENQLLSRVCGECLNWNKAPQKSLLAQVKGWLKLFVTGAPCLSCVGAIHQFQLLLPKVVLTVAIGPELQHFPLA